MNVISSTAYGQASSCLKKYEYAQVLKLVPKYDLVAPALRKGIWMHCLLEAYHGGKDWHAELDRLLVWAQDHHVPEENIQEVRQFCLSLMDNYTGYWEDPDNHEEWKVLATEQAFTLDLPKLGYQLRATIDQIVETKRGVFLVEHKTTREIPNPMWRAVDPQTALQLILVQKAGIEVDGVIFNYLLTKEPPIPRWKKDGSGFYSNSGVTTSQAFEKGWRELYSNWGGDFGEAMAYHDRMRTQLVNDDMWFQRYVVYRPDDMIRETLADVRGTLQLISTSAEMEHYPRNFHIIMCQRFCSYSELCVAEYNAGRPALGIRKEMYQIDDGTREGR